MGAALAKAALLMGAKEVHVVSGPVHVAYPLDANVVQVVTAEQMMAECRAFAARADLIVGAAAVADYRPKSPAVGKLRRSDDNLSLELIPNPDIIASIAAQTNGKVIGFAAEPDESLDYARAKLDKKGLHAIAVNNVSRAEIGFDTEVNELTLVTRERTANSGMQSKLSCAIWLFEQLS
jgi:phosphopantothenoylcysteine decarboxylase/phosphopantothenate--cysteine ligase